MCVRVCVSVVAALGQLEKCNNEGQREGDGVPSHEHNQKTRVERH